MLRACGDLLNRGDPSLRPGPFQNGPAGSGWACAISPDARCGHPCPPLARCWLVLGIPAFARQHTPARLAQAHPSRTRIPCWVRVDAIKAPRREPGGRRAVGPSRGRFPPRVHHQPAQSAFTTKQTPDTSPLPNPYSPGCKPGPRAAGRAVGLPWGRACSLPNPQVANLRPRDSAGCKPAATGFPRLQTWAHGLPPAPPSPADRPVDSCSSPGLRPSFASASCFPPAPSP